MLAYAKQAFSLWRIEQVADADWDDVHLIKSAVESCHYDPEFGYWFSGDEFL